MTIKAKSPELHLLTKYEIMIRNPPVYFHFNKQSFSLQNRRALKMFILSIFKREGFFLEEIRYVFCSDKDLLKINKEFLKHDFLTDIITFDFSKERHRIVAEIYISIDRVKENSALFNISFKKELHRVIFHGILHLCGHKDNNRTEKNKMRLKEQFYLEIYFE
jgi:rRNA maturation RNase YbeY